MTVLPCLQCLERAFHSGQDDGALGGEVSQAPTPQKTLSDPKYWLSLLPEFSSLLPCFAHRRCSHGALSAFSDHTTYATGESQGSSA